MTIYKYCRRCGKRLKGAENRARGFGKICYEKARAEAEKDMRIIVPLSNYPMEIISEQGAGEAKQEGRAKSKAKHLQSKAQSKQESKAKSNAGEQGKAKEQEGQPPHLEETLTPTHKKGLLFTPHTPTPTPER